MSEEILDLNYLSYETPEIKCAAKSTKKVQHPVNPNNYSECIGKEVMPLNFSDFRDCCYIDGSKSSISLKMRVNVPSDATMKYFAFENSLTEFIGGIDKPIIDLYNSGATIMNMFSQAVHESHNSQILYRENFINMMQTVREYRISKERKLFLSVCGGNGNQEWGWPRYQVNKDISFNIPLFLISPMWNTASLIPSKLIKNSLLSLVVNDPKKSIFPLTSTGNNIAEFPAELSVSFSQIALNLYQTELYDGIQSAIKSSQLEFPYYCYHNDLYVPLSESFSFNINLQCAKASYVALKFIEKDLNGTQNSPIRSTQINQLGDYETTVNDDNGMAISIVARVGAIVLPTYPINTASDAYISTVRAINQISYNNTENVDELKTENKLMSGCVGFTDYNYNKLGAGTTFTRGLSAGGVIFAISLEKSNISGTMSGLSLSGGRVLTIEVNGLTNYNKFNIYSQVKYMSVASINENNIVVSK
jgi:hypothetical protein